MLSIELLQQLYLLWPESPTVRDIVTALARSRGINTERKGCSSLSVRLSFSVTNHRNQRPDQQDRVYYDQANNCLIHFYKRWLPFGWSLPLCFRLAGKRHSGDRGVCLESCWVLSDSDIQQESDSR